MKDYLIVGQGVAGSLLAWELLQRHKSVTVIDNGHLSSSSIISAGIVNPITGKRFALREGFEHLFRHARTVYSKLELRLGQKLFETKPVLRLFQNEEERDHWTRKEESAELGFFKTERFLPGAFSPQLKDTLGSVRIGRAGFCRSAQLLGSVREFLKRNDDLDGSDFDHQGLKISSDHVRYAGEKYGTVVFCEGFRAQFNPYFNTLPFNSVKGEVLTLKLDAPRLPDEIINKGKWLLPQGKGMFMAGATYIWDTLDRVPTPQAREEILHGLSAALELKAQVVDHAAGIRPVLQDQIAVMGRHPQFGRLAILNGLGSKGFLVAPLYCRQLADHLEGRHALDPGVSIERFNFVKY